MIKNYLKITLRNFLNHRAYSAINVVGLALGIACCVVILLIVQHQLSYERFLSDYERLYRVVQDVHWGEGDVWSWTAAPMGPKLEQEIAAVEVATRLHFKSTLVSYENPSRAAAIRFQEDRFGYADSTFFDVFTLRFLQGNRAHALNSPEAVVVTASMAEKYFGNKDPIGKTLRIDNRFDVQVTGVIADVPDNTHLKFDFIAALPLIKRFYNMPEFSGWWWPQVTTYVRLTAGATLEQINAEQLPAFIKRHREAEVASSVVPRLQPIADIHLYGTSGDDDVIRFIYIFSAIAVFVLLIACINFTNLATARSAQRAREVGVRKVIGAGRPQLIRQFLGESFFLTLIALSLGLILAQLMLSVTNTITGLAISVDLGDLRMGISLAFLAVAVAMLAGSYPAFFLSRFLPVRVLKGANSGPAGGGRLRQGLVVLQFVISTVLIIGTLVVFNQLDFMRGKSLGFDTEEIMALPIHEDETLERGYAPFKHKLLRAPGVVSVTAANWLPGIEGGEYAPAALQGMAEELQGNVRIIFACDDFLQTMGIRVTEGRDFSTEYTTDTRGFILNETLLRGIRDQASQRGFDLDTIIDKDFRIFYTEFGRLVYERKGKIIGVARDFHIDNPRFALGSAAITMIDEDDEERNRLTHFLVRVSPENSRETLDNIRSVWNESFPHRPFEPVFVNERLANAYKAEMTFGQIVGAFAIFAIFIAGLGLLGLASFTAEQRTKEIGVRKVLGASVPGLVGLLCKEFVRLVLVAVVLASPMAYFAMSRWLQDFAYRIELGWWMFALAGGLALVIALLTVSTQAIRAALANPLRALRYE
jgi:putative ABC transport system permease protein